MACLLLRARDAPRGCGYTCASCTVPSNGSAAAGSKQHVRALSTHTHVKKRHTNTLRADISGLACISATKRRRVCAASAVAESGAPDSGSAPKLTGAKNACAEDRAMSRKPRKLYASSAMNTALRAHDAPMSAGRAEQRSPKHQKRSQDSLSEPAARQNTQRVPLLPQRQRKPLLRTQEERRTEGKIS